VAYYLRARHVTGKRAWDKCECRVRNSRRHRAVVIATTDDRAINTIGTVGERTIETTEERTIEATDSKTDDRDDRKEDDRNGRWENYMIVTDGEIFS